MLFIPALPKLGGLYAFLSKMSPKYVMISRDEKTNFQKSWVELSRDDTLIFEFLKKTCDQPLELQSICSGDTEWRHPCLRGSFSWQKSSHVHASVASTFLLLLP